MLVVKIGFSKNSPEWPLNPRPRIFIRASCIWIVITLSGNAKIILLCLDLEIAIKFFSLSRSSRNKPETGGNNIGRRWVPISWGFSSGPSKKSFCRKD